MAFIFSHACSIKLNDKVIVTGGKNRSEFGMNQVSTYNVNGFLENLPNLNVRRLLHGCGHYINVEGNEVQILKYIAS